MKNYKMLSAVLLLAVSLSITGCGGQTQEVEKETTADTDAAVQEAMDAVEASEQEALKEENLGSNQGVDLSEFEDIYSFSLDGKDYHLSCPVQEILDDGWTFSDDDVTMDGTDVVTLNEAVENGTKFDVIETPDFSLFKTIDGKDVEVMMGIYSDSTEPKTLGEYRLGFLYVKEDQGVDLKMKSGITFGDSVEKVKAEYGDPVSETDGILTYQFAEGTAAMFSNRVEFLNFYVNENKVYMISMQYFPVLSK